MKGKVVIVTGANSGIGKVTALELAKKGATVVMGCRSRERGEAARMEIVADSCSEDVHLLLVDVSDVESIRSFAQDFARRFERLDVLVNNAGVSLSDRRLNGAGHEMMFAINHLGYFVTANLLADQLAADGGGRLVNVSSMGHRGGSVDFDNLQGEKKFNALLQYCNTKLHNILFSNEYAARMSARGVTSNSLHPGAVRTNFAKGDDWWFGSAAKLGGMFLISPERGARTSVYLASSPDVEGVTGRYFARSRERKASRTARNTDLGRRLWEHSVELTGVDLPSGA